jgi:hypothetical protein
MGDASELFGCFKHLLFLSTSEVRLFHQERTFHILSFAGWKFYSANLLSQEIWSASIAVVICGIHQIPWEIFSRATSVILACSFLWKKVHFNRVSVLWKIHHLKVYRLFPVNPTLSHLISAFIETLATDPRDHIYGLLGMLPPNSHATKIEVDYRKTAEEVFQRTMEYLITFLGAFLAQGAVYPVFFRWTGGYTSHHLYWSTQVIYRGRYSNGVRLDLWLDRNSYWKPVAEKPEIHRSILGRLSSFNKYHRIRWDRGSRMTNSSNDGHRERRSGTPKSWGRSRVLLLLRLLGTRVPRLKLWHLPRESKANWPCRIEPYFLQRHIQKAARQIWTFKILYLRTNHYSGYLIRLRKD